MWLTKLPQGKSLIIDKLLIYLHEMKEERKIWAYKNYFIDFLDTLKERQKDKVYYVLDMLKTQERLNVKFVKYIREGLFEIRISSCGETLRIFFIFDEGNLVVLFNGFDKKSRTTPSAEIDMALKLKKEYYEWKREQTDKH